jgi:hypothetical protein
MQTFRRLVVSVTLVASLTAPAVPARAGGIRNPPVAGRSEQAAYGWIVRFFLRELRSWAIGRVFDEGVRRARLIGRGRDAIHNLGTIANSSTLSSSERARINGMAGQIRQIVSVLERSERSNDQVRRDLAYLQQQMQRSFAQMEQELRDLDQRVTEVELQQNRQLKMIVDTQGRVVQLERQIVNHEGRIVWLENRVRDHDDRIDDLETIVKPDPNRFLRHEWTVSGSAIYANSPVLPNDASIGGRVSAQYNMSKTFGVFADLFYAPISASDAEGFADGSRMYWQSYGALAGLSLNVLPPQSFVSLQLSGGGGIVQSSLSEYPEGVSIGDPDGGFELGSVSNGALFGKAELGIGPPVAGIEPFAGFGYLRFIDDLAYSDDATTTNAGNQLWYIALGIRFRFYDRKRSTPMAETPHPLPPPEAPAGRLARGEDP